MNKPKDGLDWLSREGFRHAIDGLKDLIRGKISINEGVRRPDGQGVGDAYHGVYVTSEGSATPMAYKLEADVTSDAFDVVSTEKNGLAPKVTDPDGYLKGDGTWVVPKTSNDYTFKTRKEYDDWRDSEEYDPEATYYIEETSAATATNIAYDNSVSGLDAENVQEAIDKAAQSGGGDSSRSFDTRADYEAWRNSPDYIPGTTCYIKVDTIASADQIEYDNSTSGLEATNLQDAVDEVSDGLDGLGDVEILFSTTTPKTDISSCPLNKSIREFRFIYAANFVADAGGGIILSKILIPTNIFRTINRVQGNYVSASFISTIFMNYVSDTEVSAMYYDTGWTFEKFIIYGIK